MQETASKEKPVEQPPLYQQPRQQVQTPPDPRAEDWASNNEWFGKDSAMTYTAFDLHRKLTEEEGIDPRSNEYYTEIDKRLDLNFRINLIHLRTNRLVNLHKTLPLQRVVQRLVVNQ